MKMLECYVAPSLDVQVAMLNFSACKYRCMMKFVKLSEHSPCRMIRTVFFGRLF